MIVSQIIQARHFSAITRAGRMLRASSARQRRYVPLALIFRRSRARPETTSSPTYISVDGVHITIAPRIALHLHQHVQFQNHLPNGTPTEAPAVNLYQRLRDHLQRWSLTSEQHQRNHLTERDVALGELWVRDRIDSHAPSHAYRFFANSRRSIRPMRMPSRHVGMLLARSTLALDPVARHLANHGTQDRWPRLAAAHPSSSVGARASSSNIGISAGKSGGANWQRGPITAWRSMLTVNIGRTGLEAHSPANEGRFSSVSSPTLLGERSRRKRRYEAMSPQSQSDVQTSIGDRPRQDAGLFRFARSAAATSTTAPSTGPSVPAQFSPTAPPTIYRSPPTERPATVERRAAPPPPSASAPSPQDIDRISAEVIRRIERRSRIERERRGIL